MSVVFVLVFGFLFANGDFKTQDVRTFSSLQECKEKGAKLFNEMVQVLEAAPDSHPFVEAGAVCEPREERKA